MTIDRPIGYLAGLVLELCRLPAETEWLEFKRNRADPVEIGKYLSALANSAALLGKANAYVVWGIDDDSHDIVGTDFCPKSKKIGNEAIENWLLRLLSPKIEFRFYALEIEEKPVILLELDAAFRHPVRFKGESFIRVGSYTKNLKDHPEKERALWRALDRIPFEQGIAAEHVSPKDALNLLDYQALFRLLGSQVPGDQKQILSALVKMKLMDECKAGDWNITNLGAILFANRLSDFSGLGRKAMRVILYRESSRTEAVREHIDGKGYANGFEELIRSIMTLVPAVEVIDQSLRRSVPMVPQLAIRELAANALIHQDLFVTGAGPMVEIFDDRMEISNPGKPLVDTHRFVDAFPESRNEALAHLMRQLGVCEERGSGIDKVVEEVERHQLPAPRFESPGENTRAVLFAHVALKEMDKTERIHACYLHACLKREMSDYLTNASLRRRFGVHERNKAMVSRYIREAVAEGAIKPFDPNAGRNLMKYVPFWA